MIMALRRDNLHRIPVRPLPYSDRDIALTRELVIDYDRGNLYITDKEDPSILIDITKLIADAYLSTINGDATNITINGEEYNLAQLLAMLKKEKFRILNSGDQIAIPTSTHIDQLSLAVKDNMIQLYGFDTAGDYARPMKKDGFIYWEEMEDNGDIREPQPGDKDNTILILPTNDKIVLYNKPQMRTYVSKILYPKYTIEMPFSRPTYSQMKLKFDAFKEDVFIQWPTNLVWIDPEVVVIPCHQTYIFSFDTWDSGRTWNVNHFHYSSSTIDPNDPNLRYVINLDGEKLLDEDGNYLIT